MNRSSLVLRVAHHRDPSSGRNCASDPSKSSGAPRAIAAAAAAACCQASFARPLVLVAGAGGPPGRASSGPGPRRTEPSRVIFVFGRVSLRSAAGQVPRRKCDGPRDAVSAGVGRQGSHRNRHTGEGEPGALARDSRPTRCGRGTVRESRDQWPGTRGPEAVTLLSEASLSRVRAVNGDFRWNHAVAPFRVVCPN
jgi:hypothetical protein